MAIVLPLEKERKMSKRDIDDSPALRERRKKGPNKELTIALPLGKDRKRTKQEIDHSPALRE